MRRLRAVPEPAAARPGPADAGPALILRPTPKPDGGVRWLTDLGERDGAAYRGAIAGLVPRIERGLGPEVVANRVRPAIDGWRLEPWHVARRRWHGALRRAASAARRDTVFAVADVRDCYASVAPAVVAAALGPDADEVVALLLRFADLGVRGLPVGPDPSAVLANAILGPLDRSVASAGVHHLRWVDDVVVWGERADVVRALAALRGAAASLGLELHDPKTRLLDDPGEVLAEAGRRRYGSAARRPVRAAGAHPRIIAAPCAPSTEPRAS